MSASMHVGFDGLAIETDDRFEVTPSDETELLALNSTNREINTHSCDSARLSLLSTAGAEMIDFVKGQLKFINAGET